VRLPFSIELVISIFHYSLPPRQTCYIISNPSPLVKVAVAVNGVDTGGLDFISYMSYLSPIETGNYRTLGELLHLRRQKIPGVTNNYLEIIRMDSRLPTILRLLRMASFPSCPICRPSDAASKKPQL
jgi:hypothetical protein